MLYFAFGSNMSLQQMARRCPHSRFLGRAVLLDYRWQINERGFANVVAHGGSLVHGLVYSIDAADEARLDRHEGVAAGSYSKAYCNVVLYPATPDLQTLPGLVACALDARRHDGPRPEQLPLVEPRALVYLSTTYVDDGLPRAEYVHRMNRGIRDALALNVPPAFFQHVVRPLLPDLPDLPDMPDRPDRPDRPDKSDRHGRHRSTRPAAPPTPSHARPSPRADGPPRSASRRPSAAGQLARKGSLSSPRTPSRPEYNRPPSRLSNMLRKLSGRSGPASGGYAAHPQIVDGDKRSGRSQRYGGYDI